MEKGPQQAQQSPRGWGGALRETLIWEADLFLSRLLS